VAVGIEIGSPESADLRSEQPPNSHQKCTIYAPNYTHFGVGRGPGLPSFQYSIYLNIV